MFHFIHKLAIAHRQAVREGTLVILLCTEIHCVWMVAWICAAYLWATVFHRAKPAIAKRRKY